MSSGGRSRPLVEILEQRQLLSNVFAVTNTLDDGSTGSLRWAIGQVNADTTDSTAIPDQIQFHIPTNDPGYNVATGVWTIAPTSALPTITQPVIVDGYTQMGATPNTIALGDNAVLTIQLDGTNAGADADGLLLTGGGSLVQGLSVTRFNDGIHLQGIGGDTIIGNFLGVAPSGTDAAGNTSKGLFIDDAPSSTVGGTALADRDLIASNGPGGDAESSSGDGIYADGSANLAVLGSYFGVDRTGSTRLGYSNIQIDLANSPLATIGGPGIEAGNVVSGTDGYGNCIDASDGNSPNVLIQGNFIGTDATGTKAIGGGGGATVFMGTILDNVIAGTSGGGLSLFSSSLVQGNFIGTDVTGTSPLGNLYGIYGLGGHNTIGGTGSSQGNVISSNSRSGILFTTMLAGFNVIQGNRIGTDVTGSVALGNGGDGITDFDEKGNTIGGPSAGEGNVISGNGGDGINLSDSSASNNLVEGNTIGVNSDGSSALPNAGDGVYLADSFNTIGGTTAGAGNVIAGNLGDGVTMLGQDVPGYNGSNLIVGNAIGTNAGSETPLGNGGDGILAYNSDNSIGGTTPARPTRWHSTASRGSLIEYGSAGNVILSNSIHDNVKLGIDLGSDGVTPILPEARTPGPTTSRIIRYCPWLLP